MKAKNLNDEQLETALNTVRMLLSFDGEVDFLAFTARQSLLVIQRCLLKESFKRQLVL